MVINSRSVSRIVLFIPCQLAACGLECLLTSDRQRRRVVLRVESEPAARRLLILQRVEMLIIAFNMQQTDWHSRLLLIRTLRDVQPELKIVAVIDVYIPFLLKQLFCLNISGILSQHDELDDIGSSIEQISDGVFCCSVRIKNALPCYPNTTQISARLNFSELITLRYLLSGYSAQRTAALMFRSKKNVIAIKNKAMHKLGVTHSAALVAMREILEEQCRELIFPPRLILKSNAPSVSPFHLTQISDNSFKTERA